ncbi:serine/threonine-protein phosphatase 2A activator isoform X1 [Dermacentor silvarum]|uniref:serine/threonine-protein phosphatase 2A activator isoform X1 n=1 Tax=Dermacentor silvarum TaxID=543639 RepID=UPI002101106E|nr:serine/threonine-protein phosphatase 2A activator isoform X1 [Dermacentor silvarum]
MSGSGEVSEYVEPKRQVQTPDDMVRWTKSEECEDHTKGAFTIICAYSEYVGFILALNEKIKGKKMTDELLLSEVTTKLLSVLETLDTWVREIPPIDQPQRFGNTAFRTWLKKVQNESVRLLGEALPSNFHGALVELVPYFNDSFGNITRIDYGTGHEMSFAMFLCCLFKVGALTEADSPAVVLRVFQRYLELVRHLQLEYRMEPAGSHGVWSLDDYQFLPFIWGSGQLIDHPTIEPKSFAAAGFSEAYSRDYMFMGCIEFISKVKTGPFHEHSNQLWNISGVPSWAKVNTGLMKMYKAEILGKFPVVQHVVFGNLLPFRPHQNLGPPK